ncbi:hypothetical protein ERJ75_000616300 [Trypanosoma vivax]|nr:hypothetical protein ERJ75_000616300 [Trypanosoma vivax]
MRQPRTQVLRSDAKAVSTRVAEGNLALTTEEREEARGPRDLAKLGQGAASELLDQRANATSVARAGDKQARTLAVETRGAAQAWQTGGEGATYGKGAGQLGRGTTGRRGRGKATWGVRGGKRAAARDRDRSEGTRGTGPGSSGEDAERQRGRKETASLNAVPQCAQRKRRVGQRGGGLCLHAWSFGGFGSGAADEDDSAHGEGDRPHGNTGQRAKELWGQSSATAGGKAVAPDRRHS